jgi:hypothetical protein
MARSASLVKAPEDSDKNVCFNPSRAQMVEEAKSMIVVLSTQQELRNKLTLRKKMSINTVLMMAGLKERAG